jgi:hypothetical protein
MMGSRCSDICHEQAIYIDGNRVAHTTSAVSSMPHANWPMGIGGNYFYPTAAKKDSYGMTASFCA